MTCSRHAPDSFAVTDRDRRLFDEHLRSFVPPGGFDAHAHLTCHKLLGREPTAIERGLPAVTDFGAYQRMLEAWMGDRRPAGGLFFHLPAPHVQRDAANRFVAEQVCGRRDARGLMLVSPDDQPEDAERVIEADGFHGFKVYHLFAKRADTFNASLPEYLPEWTWRLAHERGLVIMLHLVRREALADEDNARQIRRYCLEHPNARLVLAHAARGFHGGHTLRGIDHLRGLDNVFFDTSAVCEPVAFQAILRTFGPSRLLFGTDFFISEARGRCVSVADGFLWLYRHTLNWTEHSAFASPTFVGIEALLALKQACSLERLTDSDIEHIFCRNAREMLGIEHPGDGSTVQRQYARAREVIPGGTQLLSKRPEMFAPERWPAYYREARGCRITDTDGRTFTDMTLSGIGACPLGYADPDVNAAVVHAVERGAMCTLNSPDELTLAERLIELHPWGQMVRYARSGGEAMAAAVRLARAYRGCDTVAFCGYHGWSDWYLAANLPATPNDAGAAVADNLQGHLLPGLEPAGVPRSLAGTALPFAYNDLEGLERIVRDRGDDLAAVVMEPTRSVDPEPGFLEAVRQLCDQCGAALIFDEITAGFRLGPGGAHLRYGIEPDAAVFAKGLANGHPMAAIVGTPALMDSAQRTFVSSTYWTEAVGPAAALATLEKMQCVDLPTHLAHLGELMQAGWRELAERHGLRVHVTGHKPLSRFSFEDDDAEALMTLFTARMLDHGYLAGAAFYPSLAHEQRHVEAYLVAADAVFRELAAAHRDGSARERLGTPVRHAGFARLT